MKRVLLIERDSTLRTTFRRFLEESGYDVFDTEDGDAALEACRESLPQIVITNLSATLLEPVNSTFVTALRNEFLDMPIISTSGSLEETVKRRALDMGATLHLTKPIKFDELLSSVKELLEPENPTG